MAVEDKIRQLKEEIDRLLREKADLKARFNAEQARLRSDVQHKEARIHDLENSLSWKITAPLRSAADVLNYRGAKPAGKKTHHPPPATAHVATSAAPPVQTVPPAVTSHTEPHKKTHVATFATPRKQHDELFIYLDPGFFSDWGHYTNFATCIHEEAGKREVDLWHFSSSDVAAESITQFSLIPFFEHRAMLQAEADCLDPERSTDLTLEEALHQKLIDKKTSKSLISFKEKVETILDRLASLSDSYRKVSVYMYTAHPLHIALLAEILGKDKYASLPINVHFGLFYLNLDFCRGEKSPPYEALLAMVSRDLAVFDRAERISIYADSERTMAIYQPFIGRKITLSPIPLHRPPAREKVTIAPGRITVGFFGFAHEKQGYPLFKTLYKNLVSRPEFDHVDFIVRHNTKFASGDIQRMAEVFQNHQQRITHLPGNFLPAEIYDKYLEACDIVIIPHSRDHYPCQTSGICTDSLARGKVVVVPDETWMSDQLKTYGCGEVFPSGDAEAFIMTIKKVLGNFAEYAEKSARNIDRFALFNSARALLNIMKIGSGSADTDLLKFKDIHKGKRCFIVGNGPSLNKMDLNKLAGEYVFCSNAFFLMFPRINWRPQYFTCVDTRVLPDRAEGIIRMHEENPDMVLFFPQKVVNHETKQMTPAPEIIPPAKNRIYFNQVVPGNDNLPFSAFSIEAHKQIIQPYTVTVTALQLAVHLGFDPIYLIGCDTNYVVPDTVKQEGNDPNLGKLFFTSTKDDDPNHFCPEYFGAGRKWHNPQVHNMIWHYEMAHEATALYGRHIYNATVGGKLEVFPRVDFEELF